MAEKIRLQIQMETSMKKIQQEKNRLKALQKEQSERNDKARTNRLCRRHGLLESVLPVTIELTEEQYEKFVKQHIANKHGIAVIASITGQTVSAINTAIEDAKNKKRGKATITTADASANDKPQNGDTLTQTVTEQNPEAKQPKQSTPNATSSENSQDTTA